MTNLIKLILTAIFVFSFTLMACSSCKGNQDAISDSSITDPAIEADSDQSSNNGLELSETSEEITIDPLCSPHDSSHCFLDLSYSNLSELELCFSNSGRLIDISPTVGEEFVASGFKMFYCPEYLSRNSNKVIDLIAITNNDIFISVSEAHSYSTLAELITAVQTTTLMYEDSCERTSEMLVTDGFLCEVDDRNIVVAITASSDSENHTLIINFTSNIKTFIEVISFIE